MELKKFLKVLFEEEAVKGYEISQLEINVMSYDYQPDKEDDDGLHVCVPGMAMAKITITPMEKENG